MSTTKNSTGNKAVEVIPLQDLYDQHLLALHEKKQETKKRQGYLHASSIGYCARKNVYGAGNADIKPKVLKVEDLEIFALGHLVHGKIQEVLAKLPTNPATQITFQSEVPMGKTGELWNLFRLAGTCDGITEWFDADQRVLRREVLEIKTIGLQGPKGFEGLKKPFDTHLMQGHIYAHHFNAPFIRFWYYCKNNSKRKCYAVAFDNEFWEKTLERIMMLAEHVTKHTLPEREESWYMCQRCEYQHLCKPACVKSTGSRTRPSFGRK